MTWTPSVSTLYRNIEVLAGRRSPRSHQMRLGLRWGFGLPIGGRTDLTEYSFPLQPDGDLLGLLRRRGGLAIKRHDDPSGTAMDVYLQETREPVIAVVDSYHLPYRPAFGRVHSSRTIIVEPLDSDHVQVEDCWEPSYCGVLHRRALNAARYSDAVANPVLEPVYSGVQAPAQWFTVTVEPFRVADPQRWAQDVIELLVTEVVRTERTTDAHFGLAALRELVQLLALGGDKVWRVIPRRTLALVLRAELSSRRYLCVLLRNAVALAGRPALTAEVERYQEGLQHLQAARDVQVKSLRTARVPYDAYVLYHCRETLANEKRLLSAITEANLANTAKEVAQWTASR
ncbi:hypothetical protein [Streptomyces sp. NPDC058678]|uniref:hypothetical protein n=1 Tax=Streptomyces sp. NPDC058678 TaxID=3346595 RepID=UPI003665E7A5